MWMYKNNNIDSIDGMPDDAIGFIYEVVHVPSGKKYIGKKILKNKETGRMYIGKKFFWSLRTKPPLKGKKRRRIAYVESDWKTYYGSSDVVKKLLLESGSKNFSREILHFSHSKKNLSYLETKELFTRGVLENQDIYFNSNIAGKYFPKDLN